jgi:S-adenosylmethionine synthetase
MSSRYDTHRTNNKTTFLVENPQREDVQKLCSTFDTCQQTTFTHAKYGHLTKKDAECIPWERLCVDMIGPYTIKRNGNKPIHYEESP